MGLLLVVAGSHLRAHPRARDPCVVVGSDEVFLSDPILLHPGETQEIVVGGPVYGEALADLITQPPYYLRASLEGGVLLSAEERILLENGAISVSF